jgi:ubiquinone/menaquinone biosynthesis C-methylase UbiE
MAVENPEFNLDFRKRLRSAELDNVVPLLPPGCKILEVGAGAGWQAKELHKRGFSVVAIDINTSVYRDVQEWEIVEYDGRTIPLADGAVDIVFSSNVLEHVPEVSGFMREMERVLAPGGYMVHVMPTTTWRFFTTLSFYLYRLKVVLLRVTGQRRVEKRDSKAGASSNFETAQVPRSLLSKLFLPTLHGVRGNVLSEHYYFSAAFWRSAFEAGGQRIANEVPAGYFYTGYKVLGALLPLSTRAILAALVGSSCRIYITQKK